MRTGWNPPPWFAKPAGRLRFVRELEGLPGVGVLNSKENPAGFTVGFSLTPDGVPTRNVVVTFKVNVPHVTVDGPTDSPHRYSDGTLCMWYPWDPRNKRWLPFDGSAALVANIAAHLVKEEWWRKTGDWKGAEAPHDRPTISDEKAAS